MSGNDVEGYRSQKVSFQPSVLVFLQYSVKSVPWTFAEFRHNRIVQSPHENYFNVCRQNKEVRSHEDDLFPQGEAMLTYYSNSTNKCRVYKKVNHISGC